jgi:HEPN domain-containing protein
MVRRMVPLDADEYGRWRVQADRALQTATLAAEGEQYEWACFLAEQAAQLGVKALLHGVGAEAWGHDLVVLERRAVDVVASAWPHATADEAARLARHYIPTRYPDAHASGHPGDHYRRSDANTAAADARRILAAVDAAWARLHRDDETAAEQR